MNHSTCLGLTLLLASTACAATKPADCVEVAPTAVATPRDDAPRKESVREERVPIEVQNVSIVGAAELFSRRVGEPITIESAALPGATCTKITLNVGGAYGARDALDALDAALHGSGLRIERGDRSHRLVNVGAPRQAGCRIDDVTWTGWISAGVKKIDGATFELSAASFSLLTAQFFEFYPAAASPPAGKPGLVVLDRSHFSMFGAIGIEPGDLIVSIHGQPIAWNANATIVLGELKKVKTGGSVVVALERGGKPMTITYRIVP